MWAAAVQDSWMDTVQRTLHVVSQHQIVSQLIWSVAQLENVSFKDRPKPDWERGILIAVPSNALYDLSSHVVPLKYQNIKNTIRHKTFKIAPHKVIWSEFKTEPRIRWFQKLMSSCFESLIISKIIRRIYVSLLIRRSQLYNSVRCLTNIQFDSE